MVDSCQASSLYTKFYSPNILATASSQVGENSWAVRMLSFPSPHSSLIERRQRERDQDIGVFVIDHYTHLVLEFLEQTNKTSHQTMNDLVRSP